MNGFINTIRKVAGNAAFTGLFWLVLRLYVGYEFVTAGWEKVNSGQWLGTNTGGAISGFLKGALAKNVGAHPEVQNWYANLDKNVFLPNATLFANLVAIGELAVGLAILFGVFTKFSAFWGIILNLAFVSAGISSSNPTMIVFEVAMLFGGAGVAIYGIDFYLMPFLAKVLHTQAATATAGERG